MYMFVSMNGFLRPFFPELLAIFCQKLKMARRLWPKEFSESTLWLENLLMLLCWAKDKETDVKSELRDLRYEELVSLNV